MKRFNITVNGHTYDVQVEETENISASSPAATVAPARAPAPSPASSEPVADTAPKADPVSQEGAETLNSPMPGTIVNILVKAGDKVTKGQALLVLEAMKMENEIMSPIDSVVAGIHVNKGDSVDSGTPLVSLK